MSRSRVVKGANDSAIRGGDVRLIDAENNQVGIVPAIKAVAMAEESGLDLVLVAEDSSPPVCRLMNFSKFVYEAKRRDREQRRKQQRHKSKEVKFHANIEEHDYQTKLNHILDFLEKGHKVKVSLYLRGREMAHKDIAHELMRQLMADVGERAVIEMPPREAGRSLIMLLSPGTAKSSN